MVLALWNTKVFTGRVLNRILFSIPLRAGVKDLGRILWSQY
jgi:hypothetical protein